MANNESKPGGGALAMANEPPIFSLINSPAIRDGISAALPAHIGADRYIRMILTCMRTTPKLVLCDQRSILSALFELASLGLEPNTPLGHAFLIPYKTTATVVIGYKGYVALANRANILIDAEAVYEGDVFDYSLGTGSFVKHKPCEDPDRRGDLTHAYAIATWPDGRQRHKVITKADIAAAQSKSQAYLNDVKYKSERSPWFSDQAAMWIKTAVRRLATLLPMTSEFARALQIDEAQDRGQPQNLSAPVGVILPDTPEVAAEEADRLGNEVAAVAGVPDAIKDDAKPATKGSKKKWAPSAASKKIKPLSEDGPGDEMPPAQEP